MADIVSKERRSQIMASISSKNSKPELLLRRALHSKGYRYRLHQSNLPGKPDLVFRQFNAVLFVNGCFWHGHDCPLFKIPSTNQAFWTDKINKNRVRDKNVNERIIQDGWRILIIWECSLRGKHKINFHELIVLIENWLKSKEKIREIRGV